MTNLFTNLSKNVLCTVNGPRMDRHYIENGPIHSRQLFAVLVMLWGKLVNFANFVMQIFKLTKLTEQICAESLKCLKSLKSLMQIFATSATSASANFVGKESNESTVMYRVKSRIPSCYLRSASVITSTRIRLASLICLCMLTVGVGNVWGDVTDEITISDLTATNTTYTNFSNHAETSSARYAGNTAKGNNVIQLRASNSCGIVSTTSGGVIKSVTISWNGNTTDGRVIEVYGSNTAYSGSSDLYDNSKKGVLLGTIAKNVTTPLSVVGDFKYIGLKSNGTNTFITKFSITWTDADDPLDYVYNLVTDVSDLAAGDRVIILNTGGTYAMSTTQNTNNRAGVAAAANNWSISGNTVTLGASTTVEVMTVGRLNNHWIFVTGTGYLRAAGNSSNNYLKTNASTDTYCEWAISLNGSNEASIVGEGDNTNKTMQFYSNNFACYASATNTAIKIYKQEPPTYTVTWSAGNEDEFHTQTDVAGTALESPGTPTASTYCPGGKVFVGWTGTPIVDEDDDAPADLFTSVSGMSIPEGGTTYYAVFATSSGEGSSHYEKVTSTGDITNDGKYLIVYESSSTSAIIFDGSLNPLDASPDTIMAPISTNTISATSHVKASEFTIDMTNKYIKSASNRYIYRSSYNNGMEESTTASAVTSIAISSNKFIVKGDEGTGANSGKYTTLSYNTADAGGSTNGSRFRFYKTPSTDIYLYKYVAGASYSAYATSCVVACAGPTAATKGSFNSGTQKMPINWTSAAGKVDICYSTSSTKPDATPSASYTVVSNQTSSPVNLDVSGLSAGNYYCWVRSVCDASSTKSDWVAITGNTFTIPGHTLTITPSPAASGTFNQTSGQTVVEGRTVSITATPASGYTFSSWAVSGTSSTLSSTSTNPTTFTMGTANATVTATFSQIMVSSLTLRVQQTDQDDNTGDDLTMTCYPKEGQTGGNDPLSHTLKVLYDGALPSGALDKTVDWSVRVKAKGDADWTAVTFDGNALNANSIIHTFNKSTGTLIIKATEGTAEIKITAHDGSGVTAKVTITVANVAMSSVSVSPTEMEVYAGQKKPVTVTFTPANATDRSYSAGSSYTYVNIQNKAAASFNIEGKSSVTDAEHEETVTVTTTDGSYTATVDVTIKPLPLAHFVDNIHNESFDDVVATVSGDGLTVTTTKSTPTHSDESDPGDSYNTCERQHLHLVGWILADWADANPSATSSEISGAGSGNFYATNADIDLVAKNGKTFYAVWAKEE